jgi:hypothetical protein
VVSAGAPPALVLWDRTRGRQNVKAVASLGSMPNYLLSNNPNVKTIKDFSDKDRIAVPAAGRLPVAHAADRDRQGIRQGRFQALRQHQREPPTRMPRRP